MKLNRLTTYLLALAIGCSGQAMGTPDPERETPRTVASDNSCFSASTEASITSGINDTIRPINQAAGISNTSGYDVGSPKGTFSVNSSGAAIYNISIDAPNGGGLSPAIGVCYNSQSGNGLAGYGFNITGMSCITRGSKYLYHDSTISGTKFSSSDALFLNGQRLVIKTGAYGCNGSTYNPEGNPYLYQEESLAQGYSHILDITLR